MRRLTLTFDNGPSPETTPFVLDELASRDLLAYFFVVGRQLATCDGEALARRARDEGHIVANHSMTHSEPLGLSGDPDHVATEIAEAEHLLRAAGVAPEPPIFRPFGLGGRLGPHLLSPAAAEHLAQHGYTVVVWNSVPRDWEDIDGWTTRALADVRANEHTVLVLHDLPTGAMTHLPAFLDAVEAEDVDITLELPDDCVPMRAGVASPALPGFVGASGRTGD